MKTPKHVVDGRKEIPSNLYEAMGLKNTLSPYDTEDIGEYVAGLKSMNMADLQAHCIKVGLKPNSDRGNLIERLKKEFRANISSYKGAITKPKPAIQD